LIKRTPKIGAIVKTPEGKGLVTENNLIAGTVKVKLDNTPEDVAPKLFSVKQCKIIKNGYIKYDKKEMEELSGLE
jgi:cell fate regulator YaaT (PSP1 superfamily)